MAKTYLQEKLPTPVNGKYLHANDTTGALEWSDAQGGGSEGAVRYDVAQTLTESQKAQARDNIDLGYFSVANGVLLVNYTKED